MSGKKLVNIKVINDTNGEEESYTYQQVFDEYGYQKPIASFKEGSLISLIGFFFFDASNSIFLRN
jgi:hypothetical protein